MAACRRPERGRARGPRESARRGRFESTPARGAASQPFNRLPGATAARGWSSSKPRFNNCVTRELGHKCQVAGRGHALGRRGCIAQQRVKIGSPFGNEERTARHIGECGGVWDTQQVEDGRGQVLWFESTVAWVGAMAVARAVDLSAADAGPGECEAEDMSPVVAPALSVDPGRAAEFADGHDQGLGEQAAIVEVVEERGETDVEDRAQHVLKAVGVLGVRVPERVGDGFIAGISAAS